MNADANYSFNPWMRNYEAAPARTDWEMQQRSFALLSSLALDDETIRATRPAVAPILFPPRDGFERSEPTIGDVLGISGDSVAGGVNFSGRTSGYQGTSYPSTNQW